MKHVNLKAPFVDSLKAGLKKPQNAVTRAHGDKVAEPGDTSTYLNSDGSETVLGGPQGITYVDDQAPGVPTGITAVAGAGGDGQGVVVVSWGGGFALSEPMPPDFSHVTIYADGIRQGNVWEPNGGHTIFPGAIGTTVAVTATAVDKAGNASAHSPAVNVAITSAELDLSEIDQRFTTVEQDIEKAKDDVAKSIRESEAAITAANGKNKITTSPTAGKPTTNGTTVGDVHWVTQGEVIKEQWLWDGTAWVNQAIDGGVLAGLDVGKLTGVFANISKHLAAGSISSDKVLIGVGGNLFPDPTLTNDLLLAPFTASRRGALGTGENGEGSILIESGTSQRGAYFDLTTGGIPVTGGSDYYVHVRARAGEDNTGSNGIAVYVRAYNSSTGAWVFTTPGTLYLERGLTRNTWQSISGLVEVPTGYDRLVLGFYANTGYTGPVRFSSPSIEPAADGRLIVDGSVTAKKMKADDVAAGLMTAGLTTPTGQINGVRLDNTGITGTNAQGMQTFRIGTDGILSATGTFTIASGSSVPASTVSGALTAGNIPTLAQSKVSGLTTKLIAHDATSNAVTAITTTEGGATVVDGAKLKNSSVTGTQINPNSVGSSLVATSSIQSLPAVGRGVKFTPDGIFGYDDFGNSRFAIRNDGTNEFTGKVTITSGIVPASTIDGALTTGNIPSLSQDKITGLPAKISAHDATTTTLGALTAIESGVTVIDGGKIKTDSITATQANLGSIATGLLTSGVFQTDAAANKGMKFDNAGIHAFKTNGETLLDLDLATNTMFMHGTYRSGPVGMPSVAIVQRDATRIGSQVGVWFTANGMTPADDNEQLYGRIAGLWLDQSSSNITPNPLYIRGQDGGGVTAQGDLTALGTLRTSTLAPRPGNTNMLFDIGGRSTFAGTIEVPTIDSPGGLEIRGQGLTFVNLAGAGVSQWRNIFGPIEVNASGTFTAKGNNGYVMQTDGNIAFRTMGGGAYNQGFVNGTVVQLGLNTGNGRIERLNSSRRYKTDIQTATVDDSFLDVRVVTYQPIGTAGFIAEVYRRWEEGDLSPLTQEEAWAIAHADERHHGRIAEEAYLHPATRNQVGLDDNGRPDSYDYSKDGMKLILIVRAQRDKINNLEARLALLETRLLLK